MWVMSPVWPNTLTVLEFVPSGARQGGFRTSGPFYHLVKFNNYYIEWVLKVQGLI